MLTNSIEQSSTKGAHRYTGASTYGSHQRTDRPPTCRRYLAMPQLVTSVGSSRKNTIRPVHAGLLVSDSSIVTSTSEATSK